MKTTQTNMMKLACIAVFALAFALGALATAQAADQMKGAEHLLHLQTLQTVGDVQALKTGDTVAMVCAKCKTVWVTRVKEGVKGAQILMEGGRPTEVIGTHACKGCNSTLEVVGVQKGAHMELKHTCKACGDGSAFCCATKSGSSTTKGMEKK